MSYRDDEIDTALRAVGTLVDNQIADLESQLLDAKRNEERSVARVAELEAAIRAVDDATGMEASEGEIMLFAMVSGAPVGGGS